MAVLYRHFDLDGVLLYVGESVTEMERALSHIKKEWGAQVAQVTLEHFETKKDAKAAERVAIRAEKPLYNIQYNNENPTRLDSVARNTASIAKMEARWAAAAEKREAAEKAYVDWLDEPDRDAVVVRITPPGPRGGGQIYVQCPYSCRREHFHGSGGRGGRLALGHRTSHCGGYVKAGVVGSGVRKGYYLVLPTDWRLVVDGAEYIGPEPGLEVL